MVKRRVSTKTSRTRSAARQEIAERHSREEFRGRGNKDYSTEGEQTESLGHRAFPPGVEPAFVQVSTGGTYNLQNYESLRLDVSVTLPCLPSEIEETFQEAVEFVGEKLGDLEAEWMPKARKK